MIEKNIGKRCLRKTQFIKTKLYSINLLEKNLNIAKLSVGLDLPESTLGKTSLRFSLVKLVQTGLDKKSWIPNQLEI